VSEIEEYKLKLYKKPKDKELIVRNCEMHKYGKIFDEVWETFEDYDGMEKCIRVVSSVERESLEDKLIRLENRIKELEEKRS